MIPNGSSTKTEIVDVVSGETCADLEDFPLKLWGAVGANLDGTPIVCGGQSYGGPGYMFFKKCYKFTHSGWQEFASMKEIRVNAAGVLYKKKLHVFGGEDEGGKKYFFFCFHFHLFFR